jgi:hypothetical protein
LLLVKVTRGVEPAPIPTAEDQMAKIGRNAGTGRFTKVSTAKSKPKTHVVETIRKTTPKKKK